MDPYNQEETNLYSYQNRLKTFVRWPFNEDCSCTPENMAKAGFIHTPSENSPDTAKCFFCLKELEGWEPEDDPEKEHKAHSPACNFIALKKSVEDLTVEEILKLQKERQMFIINKNCNEAIAKLEDAAKLRRAKIIKSATTTAAALDEVEIIVEIIARAMIYLVNVGEESVEKAEGPLAAVEVQVESSSMAAVCGLHHAVLRRVQTLLQRDPEKAASTLRVERLGLRQTLQRAESVFPFESSAVASPPRGGGTEWKGTGRGCT
ncbi:baculoviral IAP repeat-containing protein 5.2-like [Diretmus argenteus]